MGLLCGASDNCAAHRSLTLTLSRQRERELQGKELERGIYKPKSCLIAAKDSGSVSDGAWPTPGTSMLVAPRSTWHIRVAVARGRMSLSAPRTIRVGHAMRANGTHRSSRFAAVAPRSGRRIFGSIFHLRPSPSGLTAHFTCSARGASGIL